MSGRKIALLAGVEIYEPNSGISNLKYASRDAAVMAQVLLEKCAFDEVCLLLAGESANDASGVSGSPTKNTLLDELERLIDSMKLDDLFLFGFFGHGLEREGRSYLLPADARLRRPDSFVELRHLEEMLRHLKARQRIILLDCCRNDPEAGRGEADNVLSERLARDISTMLAPARGTASGEPPVTVQLMATAPGKRAYEWDDKRHGAFAWHVLQALQSSECWQEGRLTANTLGAWVQRQMSQWQGGIQVPQYIQTGGADVIVLAQNVLAGEPEQAVPAARSSANTPTTTGTANQLAEKWQVFLKSREVPGANDVAISPDGRWLASGGSDETTKVWKMQSGRISHILPRLNCPLYSRHILPDGRWLISGSFFNLQADSLIYFLKGEKSAVHSTSFSSDGCWLASGYDDGAVMVWRAKTGLLVHSLKAHDDWVSSVNFSPDGRWLASGSWDNTIKLWETETGRLIRTLEGHILSVNSVSFSPDGRWLASGSWDRTIRLWEVETGRLVHTLKRHKQPISSVSFSPDGRWLASGGHDNVVRLWEVETGHDARTLIGHDKIVNSVSFSPDGRWLASGSSDDIIRLWEVETGSLVRTFEGHGNSVKSVIFSPCGHWLISNSQDKTIKLWEVQTGRLVATLAALPEGEHAIWLPDGRYAVSSPKAEQYLGLRKQEDDDASIKPLTDEYRATFLQPCIDLGNILNGLKGT